MPPTFSVHHGHLRADGDPLVLRGLNWSGLETTDRALHGLWQRQLGEMLAQVRDLGFNALRLPLSPEAIRSGYPARTDWSGARPHGATGQAQLRAAVHAAWQAGLWVLLDFHTFDPRLTGAALPGRPFAGDYSEADWLDDLRWLARLASVNHNVIGIDLCNEPHDLDWPEWADLAGRAGRTVLDEHPGLLVFVEGVAGDDRNGDACFWGENLEGAVAVPIDHRLIPAERLVWSPHVYGPDVYAQRYFEGADFPRNLPPIWERRFGRLAGRGEAVVIGEFGGHHRAGTPDRLWADELVTWMAGRGLTDAWFYWTLNPNSGDTGGLLLDDWITPDPFKLELLSRLASSPAVV